MKKIIVSLVASSYLLFGAYNSPGTDYDKAVTQSYTNEAALEGLNTINMILGFIHDSKADHFINKGPYKAMMTHDEDGEVSSSTSSKVEKLWPMTINVTRDAPTDANPNPPMKIQFWLDVTEEDGFRMRVIGFIKVTHGEDSTYPLGEFRLDAVAYGINADNSTNTNQVVMKSVVDVTKANTAGKALIKYYEEFLDDGQWEKTTINMIYDKKSKSGVVFSRGMDYELNRQIAVDLTFNKNKFKVQPLDINSTTTYSNNIVGYTEIPNSTKCKSKTEFTKKVYKYGLFYSSNGKKVPINSGFPIVKKVGNSKYHGYIGYWGLWSEGNMIQDGDTVKRDDIQNSPDYTIHIAKGKLIKHSKVTTTLGKIAGTRLSVWTSLNNNPNIAGQFILHWDKNQEKYIVDGLENCNENGCETNTTVAHGILGSSDANLSVGNWTMFWSSTLNSDIPYIATNATNDTEISYHKRETVLPSSNLTLINFGHEVINPDMNMSDLSHYPEAIEANATNGIIGKQYIYDATNQVLKDGDGKEIVLPSDANFSAPGITHRWWENGAEMGPLLTSDVASNYNSNNYWNAQNADVYYTWETGKNSWNKTEYVEKNGEIIHFDPPLVISYTHKTQNDANGDSTYDGKLFTIRYDGQSLGLPWVFVRGKGWMPQINIKSGTKIGSNEEYVVKDLSMELIPKDLNIAECSDITTNHEFDVDDSFSKLNNPNHPLVELNSSIVGNTNGALVGTTPPDANVTVVKGKLIEK